MELALFGNNLFGEIVKPKSSGPVAERFTFPPFSVLDARGGEWQDRKRAWAGMGIKGEVGRGDNLIKYSETTSLGDKDTSIFDPVLTELIYRWFSMGGGQIVDPFAGGSVRGIVAGALGRNYWGCDLRAEQISANEKQADEIETVTRPVWVCGDSMETMKDAPESDLIFSCPPYGDLEVYSDNPSDLSNMEWHTFIAAYKRIILRCVQRMKQDSFACFVVGDFRDGKGFYRNFVSETIDGFQQAGARLYNEGILVTSVGSASMRVSKQFESGRKFAKTHQNVLVFVKGDWKKASDKLTI